jgi:hypothetical protein
MHGGDGLVAMMTGLVVWSVGRRPGLNGLQLQWRAPLVGFQVDLTGVVDLKTGSG